MRRLAPLRAATTAAAIVAVAVLVALVAAVLPSRPGGEPPARPRLGTLVRRPGDFAGKRVSVVGVLRARGDRRVARLHERGGARSVLVAVPPGVAMPPPGTLVSVTGRFHRLDEATAAAAEQGDPLADNAPIIRAQRIRPLPPEEGS